MIDIEARPDTGVIDQLVGMLGEDTQQTGHLLGLLDLRDVLKIALKDGVDIVEGEKDHALASKLLRQRGLAGLTWPDEQNDTRIDQGLPE